MSASARTALTALTALTAIAPISWGTTYVVTSEWLPPDRPLLSGLLRALPAGLLAIAIGRRLPHGSWWWRAAVLGVLNIGAFFALLFLAAYRLPGGVAATLGAIGPLATAGFALALLGEPPTRWRLGWAMVGIAGVALMVMRPGAEFDAVGVVAGLTGPVAMSAGVVLTRRWGRPVGAVSFAGWQLTAGGLFLLPIALIVEGAPPHLPIEAFGGYAWLGLVGTLLAYTLWFRGIGELPVVAVSFLALLSPIVATTIGWAVLGQSLTTMQTVGFGLTLLAVLAAQIPRPQRVAPRIPKPALTQESSCR
ncbi:EamA family transporter [Aeromicrobium sp.]|uniref:EamA family transporter n=1 Tax=Aeromicrobium sp. TaxID=1871063 RepID=UPI00199B69F8|nr:EamA family transporter [Aeromicrobium sp.]MBC7632384.1 EamA family transporter [Aeromicrobium sp.]